MKKIITPIVLIIIIIFLIIYSLFFYDTVSNSSGYTYEKSDAIVVLGYSLLDGLYPSYFLEKRLVTALELYNDDYSKNIIVSGGQGPMDKTSVANVMKNWLMERGVSDEDIILETNAGSTYENFAYSKELANSLGYESIIYVTNDFHMNRSMITGSEFFETIYGADSQLDFSIQKFLNLVKEPLSLINYYLFDKNSIVV